MPGPGNQPVNNPNKRYGQGGGNTAGHCRCGCGNCKSDSHCKNVAAGCAMR